MSQSKQITAAILASKLTTPIGALIIMSVAISTVQAQFPGIPPFFNQPPPPPPPPFGMGSFRQPMRPLQSPPSSMFNYDNPGSSWFRPPSIPNFTTYPQYRPQYAKPPSPARQCRLSGACRQVDHGTTLPTTWLLPSMTTPLPVLKTTPRSLSLSTARLPATRVTTRAPLLDRIDSEPMSDNEIVPPTTTTGKPETLLKENLTTTTMASLNASAITNMTTTAAASNVSAVSLATDSTTTPANSTEETTTESAAELTTPLMSLIGSTTQATSPSTGLVSSELSF